MFPKVPAQDHCVKRIAFRGRSGGVSVSRAVRAADVHRREPEGDFYAVMQHRYFEVISLGVDAKVAHAASQHFIAYGLQRGRRWD
jgi:hypothetical protein